MPARSAINYPATAYGPSVQPGHIGLGSAFVEEDQTMRIHAVEAFPPRLALGLYIGALLFAGVQRLFFRLQPNFSSAR